MWSWIYEHIINTIYFIVSIVGLLFIVWCVLFYYCFKTDTNDNNEKKM
ncbi:hypothetical protein ACQCT6_13065 [Cytobacillus gottheilii]|uniref:DUF3149 domain-containing protein n=2 Tax=Cytobacillus gottheilii TaxID=859144 RepID=A0ABX8F5C6_9BACI|nr:hypothetical protein [Cytobacillus gottheilii]QVY59660.1 hypothetical protein J1899_11305 [Cytobacillus gottheilii]